MQVQGLRWRGIWSLLDVNDNSRAERNAEIACGTIDYRVQVQGLRWRGFWSLLGVNDNSRAERNAEIVCESLLFIDLRTPLGKP